MPARGSLTGFGGNADSRASAARNAPKPAVFGTVKKIGFDPVSTGGKRMLIFEGSNHLRARLLLSTLTTKPVKIKDIRANDDNPGLKSFEANFLRLLDKITNGTILEVNETGTALTYKPGVLIGGSFDHECNNERSISYYLEPLLILAPFAKKRMTVRLKGVTQNEIDVSVDTLKKCSLPVLRRFLPDDDDLDINVVARGVPPGGGGEVVLSCPVCRSLRPVQMKDQGKIKRIRGVAYALRVSPAMANRIVDAAKGELLKFIPDVYINTDNSRGAKAGRSPGFGVQLFAESNTGCFWAGESVSKPRKRHQATTKSLREAATSFGEMGVEAQADYNADEGGGKRGGEGGDSNEISVPEDVGRRAAHSLLDEIYRGGCVDSSAQGLAFLLMALGPPDVSKIVTGPLSSHGIECLRLIKQFLGVTFKLEPFDPSSSSAAAVVKTVAPPPPPPSSLSSARERSGSMGENDDGNDSEEELAMGAVKVLATCVGVGFSNLNKTVS